LSAGPGQPRISSGSQAAGGEGGQGDREQDHDHRVRNGAPDDIGHRALVGPDSLRDKPVHAHGRDDRAKLANQHDEDAEPDWIDADSADNRDNERFGGDHYRERGHEHAQHQVEQDQAQQDGDAADGGYNAQQTFEAAAASYPLRLEIIRRTPDAVGFGVIPKRWVVERTFSWFGRNRRLAKDFENLA
jgi:hypothetical protein